MIDVANKTRIPFDDVCADAIARARETLEQPFDALTTDVVPSVADLDAHANEGALIETAILYCDMRGSSSLAEDHRRGTAARIYRSLLNLVVDIGRHYNGKVRAFAGDQVMMLFDRSPDTLRFAMQAALGIQAAVEENLNPIISRLFGRDVHCGVGVDFGQMLAIRVGGRGRSISDIVWVGRPANVACHLCNSARGGEIAVTPAVFENMPTGFKSPVLWGVLGNLLGDDVWDAQRPFLEPVSSYRARWDAVADCLASSDDEDNR